MNKYKTYMAPVITATLKEVKEKGLAEHYRYSSILNQQKTMKHYYIHIGQHSNSDCTTFECAAFPAWNFKEALDYALMEAEERGGQITEIRLTCPA